MKPVPKHEIQSPFQIETKEQGRVLVTEMLREATVYHDVLDHYNAILRGAASNFGDDELLVLRACRLLRTYFNLDPSSCGFRRRLEVFVLSELLAACDEPPSFDFLNRYLDEPNYKPDSAQVYSGKPYLDDDGDLAPIVTNVYHLDRSSTLLTGVNVIGVRQCKGYLPLVTELAIGINRHSEQNDCVVIFASEYEYYDIYSCIISNLSGACWPQDGGIDEIGKEAQACAAFEKGLSLFRAGSLSKRILFCPGKTASEIKTFVRQAKRISGASRAIVLMDEWCTGSSFSLDRDRKRYADRFQDAQQVFESELVDAVVLSFEFLEYFEDLDALAWEVLKCSIPTDELNSFWALESPSRPKIAAVLDEPSSDPHTYELQDGRRVINDRRNPSMVLRSINSGDRDSCETMHFQYNKRTSRVYSVVGATNGRFQADC